MMNGNFLPLPSDGGYIFDQSLEFITEGFENNTNDTLIINNHHHHNNNNNKRRSLSSVNTLGSGASQDTTRKPPRPQRQKSLTSEQTKHRRTRSGCYTCRQRRVKCDEGRPICDRCRKGKRDCTYPDKTTSSKSNRTAQKSKSPDTYSSSSSDEQEDSQQAFTTPDASESTSVASFRPGRADSKRSTILEEYNGAMGEIQSQFDQSVKLTPVGMVLELFPEWSTLPKDIKFYLEFFRDNITYCHFAFKHDCRDFLKTAYLEAAISFKPLLYALVSFTAYHYALRYPDTKPEKFLDYYDQAVSLFRASLAKGNTNAVPVLMTMLQLATIEEFLGDWVGLLNHQKAAAKLMQETFTPDAMTQTFTHRVILVWYWRFDLFAGLISGSPLTLPREWFSSCADSCAAAAARNTDGNIGVWFDHFFTKSRMLVTDITLTFAQRSAAGAVEEDDFQEKVVKLWARIQEHAQRVEGAFRDVACFSNDFLESDDNLTDYKDPNFLYTGPYFTMNYILADSLAGRTVFLHFLNQLRNRGMYTHVEPAIPPEHKKEIAMRLCKVFEATQYSRSSPAGAVLGLQASLAIVALSLPHEPIFTNWTRRKLAIMEANGYIYPPSYRKGISKIWKLEVDYWWLPDGEGLTPLLRSMRQFIDFRAKSAQRPPTDRDVEVRDMAGVFRYMTLTPETIEELAMTD